jgi:hypothetical protein
MLRALMSLSLVLVATAGSHAAVTTFSATDGSRSAKAVFETMGSTLTVTLTNDAATDVLLPVDVLTGVFFSAPGLSTLSPVSAVVPATSSIVFGTGEGVDFRGVGGEWAFASGISGPHSATLGISAAGLGLFGPSNVFPGSNLQGAVNVGGLEYGILSAGDNPATGNTPVTGPNALIKHAVVFTFAGLPSSFDLASISNVSFQYGTALSEPNILVPTPASAGALVFGTLLCFRRRR